MAREVEQIDVSALTKGKITKWLTEFAVSAYDAGPGWGKANDEQAEFRIKYRLTDAEIAVLDGAKRIAYDAFQARVRPMNKNELNKHCWMTRYSYEPITLPESIKTAFPYLNLSLRCLSHHVVNGRDIADFLPFENTLLSCDSSNWKIGRDPDGRLYAVKSVHPRSEAIPYSCRNGRWPRGKKRTEFVKTVIDMYKDLKDKHGQATSFCTDSETTQYSSFSTRRVYGRWVMFEAVREPVAAVQPASEPVEPAVQQGPDVSVIRASVCFTGTLPHMGRREAAAKAIAAGLEVKSSVTADLTYLVQADPTSESSKSRKAAELGVTILDERGFLEMLRNEGTGMAA